ncbi:TraB/GumN family protein [Massilia sp. B-10]|nr:TraB/GumN family protein [Massilia sp. B-10]
MSLQRTSLFCLFLLAAPAWAQTAPDPAAAVAAAADSAAAEAVAAEAAPEKILVVGQRPGPGLWKVSKGEHVLWIFGTYALLPEKMEWRAHEVETILAQSQEFIQSPSAKLDISIWRAMTMLPLAIGLQKNPDGATLKDVLPADLYARWLPFKEKYIGQNDDIERKRPIFVAEQLYRAALQKAHLENDYKVHATIDQIVKKNKLKVTNPAVVVPIKDPRAVLKDFKKSSLEDAACFSATLDRLETDIDALKGAPTPGPSATSTSSRASISVTANKPARTP